MSIGNPAVRRWLIAASGVLIMTLLGTVYAWSVFVNPIVAACGWSQQSVAVVFMILIGMIGLSAAFGGILVDRKGPVFTAALGVILYGAGVILGGVALSVGSLPILYLGYGFIGGVGNGLAYVVPIATLIRWFPDKRGFITGLSVMGFGLGAFFIGKIVPGLINTMGVAHVFYVLGIVYLAGNILAVLVLRDPPAGWLPAGFTASARTVSAADSFSWKEARRTPQWYMIWGMLFLNITAGVGLLSKLSPMAQEVIRSARGISDPGQLAVLVRSGGRRGFRLQRPRPAFLGGSLRQDRAKECLPDHVRHPGGRSTFTFPGSTASGCSRSSPATSSPALAADLPSCPLLRPTASARPISARCTALF